MSTDTRAPVHDESVLSRWSRRKREAEHVPAAGEDLIEQEPADSSAAALDEAVEARPALTDADMPDIDSLSDDSDFSPFMSPGVSEELRNLALRKLFHAPVFNIRDGLDEYDEDYTTFEKLGGIVTADMKHQIEMQQQKLREALQQEHEDEQSAELEDVELDQDEAVEAMQEADTQVAASFDDAATASGSKHE